MRGLLSTLRLYLQWWWRELRLTLWARRLSAQQLRDEYHTAVRLEVDRWGTTEMRRRLELVEREMTRRGLDP